MQVTVDLALVSFLLFTSAPDQTPHHTHPGGELVRDHGAGDRGFVLARAQAGKARHSDIASRRRPALAKVPTYPRAASAVDLTLERFSVTSAGAGPAQLKVPASRASWRDVVGQVPVCPAFAPEPVLHSPRSPRPAPACEMPWARCSCTSSRSWSHRRRSCAAVWGHFRGRAGAAWASARPSQGCGSSLGKRKGFPKGDASDKPRLTAFAATRQVDERKVLPRPTPRRSPT